jgi:hypothetical protein
MKSKSATLKAQLNTSEFKLKCVSSYVHELTAMTAKHHTPKRAYVSDLTKAKENVGFYEAEIKRIKKEMGVGPKIGPVTNVVPAKKVVPTKKTVPAKKAVPAKKTGLKILAKKTKR